MENKNESEDSKIVEFFRNSTVFLTGGTGFIGKVMICKLFSTCQVSCIYLLVRQKSPKSGSERLQELLNESVFVHLASKVPDLANRIKLVEGDCSLEKLGLSADNEKTLCESVNFIIHCAAAMDMLGDCKKSIQINIRGTVHLVDLAKKMINLKTFVYLSSIFTLMEREEIDEKLYELHLEYEDLLNLLKIDDVLPLAEQNRKRIIGNKLTMYGLTKAAAENIFIREKISVPVVIFRFGLAISCLKEPMTGWTNRHYGPNGIFALSLLDMIPATYWKNKILIDCAPADLVVNAIIAATQYSHNEYQKINDRSTKISPFVYNCSYKFHENALSFEYLMSYMKREFNFTHQFYSNKLIFILWCIMFGYIPTLVIDFFLILFGSKFRSFRAYRSLVRLNYELVPINLSSPVNMNNVEKCWKSLNSIDRKLFSFDLNEVVWDEYMPLFANSIREYLFTLLEKNNQMRIAVFWVPKIRLAFKILYCALGLYFVYFIISWLMQLTMV